MFIKLLFSLFTIIIIGYVIVELILKKLEIFSMLELFAITFGVGCAVVVLEMFFMSSLKIRFTILNILVFQIPLYILAMHRFFKKGHTPFGNIKKPKFSIIEIIFILFIVFNICYVLLVAISTPFTAWDTWTHWGYKAKIFFSKRTIDNHIFRKVGEGGCYNPDYPLLIPLLESYIWIFLGNLYEPYAKLLGVLYYVCILIIFYFGLKKIYKRSFALGFTLVLSSLPGISLLAPIGYADVPMGFYITAAVIYIWLYLKDKDFSYLLLGALFLGIGMWTKKEGISQWFAVVSSIIFLRFIKQIDLSKKSIIFLIALPLILILPWIIFRISHGLTKFAYYDPVEPFSLLEPKRLPMILSLLVQQLIDVWQWNLLWIIFIITLFISFRRSKAENMFLLYFILLQMTIYVVVHFLLPNELERLRWHILNTFDRIFAQIAAIVLFFIAQQLSSIFINAQDSIKNK